ncbi:hypothetical protein HZS_2766, partial [Henneguya salminicola]
MPGYLNIYFILINRFFSNESVMDQFFIDQAHRRSGNRQLISCNLSETYRAGINTLIKNMCWQRSPILPYFIVTVAGLFKYNGASWPFIHIYYITATLYKQQKFLITNCVLYDCINPSQIVDENGALGEAHSRPSIKEDLSRNMFDTMDNIVDQTNQLIVSEPKFSHISKPPHISTKLLVKSIQDTNNLNGNINRNNASPSHIRDLSSAKVIQNSRDDFDKKYVDPMNSYIDSHRKLSAELYTPQRDKSEDDSPTETSTEYSFDSNTLFVGSYSESTTEDDIYKLFSSYYFQLIQGFGPIQMIKMIIQKKIAFVTYKNANSVVTALKEAELKIGDRILRVQQRKIINTVKHVRRENLELYGYSKDEYLPGANMSPGGDHEPPTTRTRLV